MVYQIFNDGIESSTPSLVRKKQFKIKPEAGRRKGPLKANTTSVWRLQATNLLVILIRILLLLYDAISLPAYFILQRPDRRARECERMRSQQVEANTWIRTLASDSEENNCRQDSSYRPLRVKFMGATMSEIFTNSIREFHSKACLGYRAVVTCPMLTQNELGEHVLEEKSFRSDYTWYTYGQIGRRVQDIASGLYHHSVFPTSRAMFLAGTCLEWFCAAQACFQLAIELVLVPDANDLKTLELIMIDSETQVLFVTCDQLERVCKLLDLISSLDSEYLDFDKISLKRIILIDWQFSIDFDEIQFQQLGRSVERASRSDNKWKLEILSLGQIEEAGVEWPIQLRCSSAISEEHLNHDEQFRHQDGDGLTDSNNGNKYKSTSRYFNFSSNSNGLNCSQPTKRRKISGPNETTSSLVDAAQERGSNGLNSMNELKISSAPLRRRHGNNLSQRSRASIDEKSIKSRQIDNSKAPRPDDLAMVVYTYGSLGQLKPIMLTHSQLARSSNQMFLDGKIAGHQVHCAILSLDNVIEFMIEICVCAHGGSIGYSCNLQTYFYDGPALFPRDKSDLEALEPTFLLVRPYTLERLRKSTRNYLQLQLNPIMSFIFKNVICDYKKFWLRRHFETPIINRLFCSKLKRLFGSRIKYILCNGPADCSATKDFFALMLDLPVIELYGPDEAAASLMSVSSLWDQEQGGKLSNGSTRRPEKSGYGWRLFQFDLNKPLPPSASSRDLDCDGENLEDYEQIQLMPPTINRNIYKENLSRNILIISTILQPTRGTRIRLEDWEEFRAIDLPYPRGRLVIGGDVVCKGYLKRPMLTQETFNLDSNNVNWFRTGDIARAFPNGSFEIISAISDMIKMVDGQFISLSQIEHLIRSSQFVDNVCALCGSERKFVINLVVPNLRRLALKSMRSESSLEISMEPEPEELADVEFRREVCNDRLLCEFVNTHLSEILARAGLSSIKNKFLLVPEIWTPESELVTAAFRPKRDAIQKFYANDIQAIVRFEFGNSTSRRLSARRQQALAPGQPVRTNHHVTNRSSGSSLFSVNSI